MFRIAICDDESVICSQIEKIILNYGIIKSFDFEVDIYYSGEKLYRFLEEGSYYDLIFLDIGLKQLNGIDLGRKIRDVLKNEDILIVYISGRDDCAMELFEVRPMNFLIKPLKTERIISVLEKGMELANTLYQTFVYKQGYRLIKIPIKNILYFESLNRKVKIATTEGEEIFYGALTDIFSQVEEYGFFYCHRSYLVNYHNILNFKYQNLLMKNGEKLPISQPKRKSVRAMLIKYEIKGAKI